MASANQPCKLFVSSRDSEWGVDGYVVNITLPESIIDAVGVECSRAVVPNSLYPIPDYQNKFYFRWSNGVGNAPVLTLTLTNNRYFANPEDLVAQLNLDAVNQNLAIVFTYDSTLKRISFAPTDPSNHMVLACPESDWLTKFALNTRLGFTDRQSEFQTSWTATLLPNLIRTKVIYLCSNISMDDTMNANGAMRNCIAKIPNQAFFGGLNIYEPKYPIFGRFVGSNIQRVQVSLLDDCLQPYNLAEEEVWEAEFQFRY